MPSWLAWPLGLVVAVACVVGGWLYVTWAMQARTVGWVSALVLAVLALAGLGYMRDHRG